MGRLTCSTWMPTDTHTHTHKITDTSKLGALLFGCGQLHIQARMTETRRHWCPRVCPVNDQWFPTFFDLWTQGQKYSKELQQRSLVQSRDHSRHSRYTSSEIHSKIVSVILSVRHLRKPHVGSRPQSWKTSIWSLQSRQLWYWSLLTRTPVL